MGPNFTPLNLPHSPSVPPSPPRAPKKSFSKKSFAVVSGLILFIGIISGYIAMSSGLFYKSRATGSTSAPACPTGTEKLFTQTSGSITVGYTTAAGGKVTSETGDWKLESRDGVPLAANPGKTMIVTFPSDVILDSVLVFDNDHDPWKINGVSIPTTGDNKWGPLFKINLTVKQMSFDNNDDSPHFNVCIRQSIPTPSPTKTPTPVQSNTPTPTTKPSNTPPPSATLACPKPNPVKNLRINCPICNGN